mmetsp:Transcript_76484/g.212443  ORF Transcript_76484/g.212443 Transcript_76484/m.212443 type:complete len:359 (-) Transcript_76484:14-1090(-)
MIHGGAHEYDRYLVEGGEDLQRHSRSAAYDAQFRNRQDDNRCANAGHAREKDLVLKSLPRERMCFEDERQSEADKASDGQSPRRKLQLRHAPQCRSGRRVHNDLDQRPPLRAEDHGDEHQHNAMGMLHCKRRCLDPLLGAQALQHPAGDDAERRRRPQIPQPLQVPEPSCDHHEQNEHRVHHCLHGHGQELNRLVVKAEFCALEATDEEYFPPIACPHGRRRQRRSALGKPRQRPSSWRGENVDQRGEREWIWKGTGSVPCSWRSDSALEDQRNRHSGCPPQGDQGRDHRGPAQPALAPPVEVFVAIEATAKRHPLVPRALPDREGERHVGRCPSGVLGFLHVAHQGMGAAPRADPIG